MKDLRTRLKPVSLLALLGALIAVALLAAGCEFLGLTRTGDGTVEDLRDLDPAIWGRKAIEHRTS